MRKQILLVIFTALLFNVMQCFSQTKSVLPKILRPAAFTIPARIQKIVLVDRSCNKCFRSANGQRIYSGPDTTEYSTLAALKLQLLNAKRYTITLGALDTSFLANEIKQVMPPLSWNAVATVTANDPSALLIVLEEQNWQFKNDYIYQHFVWRIYDGESQTMLDEYEQIHEYRAPVKYRANMPLAPSKAIYNYACRIMPHWQWEMRDYYTGGNEKMKLASACAEKNDWTGAAAYWSQAANDSSNVKLQRKSCFNVALCMEFAGSFDSALEWIARAEKLGEPEAAKYAATIRVRKSEAAKITEQLLAKQGQMPAVR